MARSTNPLNHASVPTLDANGSLMLTMGLLSAASGEALPEAIDEALTKMGRERARLDEVAILRHEGAPVVDRRGPQLDQASAWRGLRAWTSAMEASPVAEEKAAAARIAHALFPDGLAFQRLPAGDVWAEADRRLGVAGRNGVQADIERLGGGRLFEHVRRTHETFGRSRRITDKGNEVELPALKSALDGLHEATRSYVVQVVAFGARSAEGADLERRLLRPLDLKRAEQASRRAKRRAANGAEAPAAEVEADVAPGSGVAAHAADAEADAKPAANGEPGVKPAVAAAPAIA